MSYDADYMEKHWIKQIEKCIEFANFHGMVLTVGELLEIRLRGRVREDWRVKFKCYNPYWGTLYVEDVETGEDILIKVKDIIWLKRKKIFNEKNTT